MNEAPASAGASFLWASPGRLCVNWHFYQQNSFQVLAKVSVTLGIPNL
ncbi:hypothetical protein ACVWY1_004684 [Pseudomonas sp. TE6288]